MSKLPVYKQVFNEQQETVVAYRAKLDAHDYNSQETQMLEFRLFDALLHAYYERTTYFSIPKNLSRRFWQLVVTR